MKNKARRVHDFFASAPLPLFSFVGLIIGIIASLIFPFTKLADAIWYTTLLLGGTPIVVKTWLGIFRGHFASDIVAMLAIVTAASLGQAFAGAVVVIMQSGGEAIEAYGLKKATSSLNALLKRAPRTARRKIGDTMEEILVSAVTIGDILIVRPGDLIPVDGTIVAGFTDIDESAITGEPLTKAKTVGDHLLSGSINSSGVIEMRADKKSEESQYAKIVELVRQAQANKAPMQRLADRYAIIFTPLTLLIGLIGYLITGNTTTILAVLVVATPCPLIIAAPLAVISAINSAARRGIIVKGGAPIEHVALTEAVVFDKTGTITFGTPYVEEVVALADESADEVLMHAATIDQLSSHSTAKAIVTKALIKNSTLPLAAHFQELPGQGVEGTINNTVYAVGSHAYIENKVGSHILAGHGQIIDHYFQKNKLLVYVARDNVCLGIIVLSDLIRPEVPALIKRLQGLGVLQIQMLTGDSKKNAAVIARQAGIDTVGAELLPEEKVEAICALSTTYNHVVMVGDGINDAPALATATVGIAMGAYGTAISAEAADIVLLVDDLNKVADAIAIGKRMLFIAKQSIFIGIGLSLILMGIAATGHIAPAAGAILQELIDVTVILNALRAR